MSDFQKVMRLLGPHWDYIVTDQSGNMERLAFVFDTRKIRFRHVAGEIVLPAKKGKEVIQFNRTPFLVAFQAGWFKFNICTVHIYYGTAQDTAQRRREITDIAAFFTTRQKKDGETYILLGDFNILNPDDPTMNSLLGQRLRGARGVAKTDGAGERQLLRSDRPAHAEQAGRDQERRLLPLAGLCVPRRCRLWGLQTIDADGDQDGKGREDGQ